jgi:hypothetical protein
MYLIEGNEGFSMTDCFQLAIATKREGKKRAFTQVFFLLGRLDQGGLENPPLTTAKQKEKNENTVFLWQHTNASFIFQYTHSSLLFSISINLQLRSNILVLTI